MKTKSKILTINLLVIFVTILTFLTATFTVVLRVFSGKDLRGEVFSVSVEGTTAFEKTGYLNLLTDSVSTTNIDPITISNKEDAIYYFNKYLDENFYTGKVKSISSTLVIGGGELGPIRRNYWGYLIEEKTYKDGVFRNYSFYCKVPNEDGIDHGDYDQDNYIREETIQNGVLTRRFVVDDSVCYYTADSSGKYNVYARDGVAFTNEEKSQYLMDNDILPFLINENTVVSVEIDSSSSFVINVKFNLTNQSLASYKQNIKDENSDNKDLPKFEAFSFSVTFNKYTAEIISMKRNERYILPNLIDVNMIRTGETVFKKEN